MRIVYQALTDEGEERSGVIDARNVEEARKTLNQQGLLLIRYQKPEEDGASQSRLRRLLSRVWLFLCPWCNGQAEER